MTPFYIVDDEVVVHSEARLSVRARIGRASEFVPAYHCGVQLEPISFPTYSQILAWLKEKDFDSILVDDFDTLFFGNDADLTLFLLQWSNYDNL